MRLGSRLLALVLIGAGLTLLSGAASKSEQRAWRILEKTAEAEQPADLLARALAYLDEFAGGEYVLAAHRLAGEAAFALKDWAVARNHLEAYLTLGGRDEIDDVKLLVAVAVAEGGQRESGLNQLRSLVASASNPGVIQRAARELVAQELFRGSWRAALEAQGPLLEKRLFDAEQDLADSRAAIAAAKRAAKGEGRVFAKADWGMLERGVKGTALRGLVAFLHLDDDGQLRDDASTIDARRAWASQFHDHPLISAVPGGEGFASAPEDSLSDAIGLLLPMSGRYAAPGELVKRGVDLALAEAAERGWPKVRLIVEDSRGEAEPAAAGLRRLVDEEKVIAVLGPIISAEAEATVALASELGTPTVMMTQTPGLVDDSPFAFNGWVHPDTQVRALVEHTIGRLGLTHFAIAYPDKESAAALAGMFWDEVERAGGTVTSVESYPAESTDFRETGRRLKGNWYKANPPGELDSKLPFLAGRRKPQLTAPGVLVPGTDFQAIFVPDSYRRVTMLAPGFVFEEINVGGHLRSTRGKEHPPVTLLGGSAFNHPDLVARGGGYTEGTIFVDGFFPGGSDESVTRFVERYRSAYGGDPTILEATAYDTALFVCQLLADGVKSRRELVRRLSLSTPLESVTGARGFGPERAMAHQLKTLQVVNDHIVQVWPVPPPQQP